jgi:hypothetical protein
MPVYRKKLCKLARFAQDPTMQTMPQGQFKFLSLLCSIKEKRAFLLLQYQIQPILKPTKISNLESMLQNSISAENVSDKFSSQKISRRFFQISNQQWHFF